MLLTGASGYIGSVVLEQLLRTTDVASVVLLLRERRGQSVAERAAALLRGPLFRLVRDQPALVAKVGAVAGDIQLPGLGLSPSDRACLTERSGGVDFIVHCAADIRLEPTIRETLVANFEGTRSVLELAAACAPRLRALVHVSSAFVNVNRPRSSVVAERLYPLKFGEQPADAEAVAAELMSLPPGDADMRALVYQRRWGFPNTYTLGKHLTEHLVASYQARHGLPVAIVRPSLVSAMAGAPCPGYAGNWAGCIGAGAAMAIGLFDCLDSVASQPLGVWDIVPSDLVGSAIIAAAAAVAAGVAPSICSATGTGGRSGGGGVNGSGGNSGASGGAANSGLVARAGSARAARIAAVTARISISGSSSGGAKAGGVRPPSTPPLQLSEDSVVLSGASSPRSTSVSDDGASDGSDGSSHDSSSGGRGSGGGASAMRRAGARLLSRLSSASADAAFAGGAVAAAAAAAAAAQQQQQQQQQLALQQQQRQQRQRGALLVVHAATSSTYPLTLMEGFNYNLEFFAAHPPPFSITRGRLPRMTDAFAPSDARVAARRAWTGWKVWLVCALLRLLGRQKAAQKLQTAFLTFCVHNNSKTDKDLTFSTRALVALEARLAPAERADYLLVWRPMPAAAAAGGAASAGGAGAASGAHPVRGGALAGVRGDVCWRRYCHTQMAGIYAMLFRAAAPRAAAMRHAVGGGPLPAGAREAADAAAAAALAADGRKKLQLPGGSGGGDGCTDAGSSGGGGGAFGEYVITHDFDAAALGVAPAAAAAAH